MRENRIIRRINISDLRRATRLLSTICLILILTTSALAQNGLFIRFSVGPGFMDEFTGINGTGYTIASKNHAIGWGFGDKYAIYVGEFGGLIKKQVGEYSHINLDATGLGFIYRMPAQFELSLGAGIGQVALAENWKEPIGDVDGEGFGINISLEKNWMFSNRWKLGMGPQVFYLKTKNNDYDFLNGSFNIFINYCFSQSKD